MYVNEEWFCRVVTNNLLRSRNTLKLRVQTDQEQIDFILHARKGGDVFRLNKIDTEELISLLSRSKNAEFSLGSSTKKVDCEEFQKLLKKGIKKQMRLTDFI